MSARGSSSTRRWRASSALNPRLNAYRVVFAERALAEADQVDAERRRRIVTARCSGVPVAIKDDADVAGEITAWGTDAHGGPKPVDSDVVTRLRAAGAIVIGKTHVPEMTMWPWTASMTWGAARNPWDTRRTPGRFQRGLGRRGRRRDVRRRAGLRRRRIDPLSVGAEPGCSGSSPSATAIPLGPDHHDAWNGLTVYGPLARTVRDAALFLDATADDRPERGFLAALDDGPEPLRIAVSFKPPLGALTRLRRRAPAGAGARPRTLLRALGHEVFEAEVDYGPERVGAVHRALPERARSTTSTRWPTRERLERRRARLVGLGRRIPDDWLARVAGRTSRRLAARMNRSFEGPTSC